MSRQFFSKNKIYDSAQGCPSRAEPQRSSSEARTTGPDSSILAMLLFGIYLDIYQIQLFQSSVGKTMF